MQVKSISALFRRYVVVKGLKWALILLGVPVLLIWLVMVSRLDIEYIGGQVTIALGVEPSDLRFVGGGRRYQGMIMFEYLGDKTPLAKFMPTASEKRLLESDDSFKLWKAGLLKWFRSFIKKLNIPVCLNDDVVLSPCCSEVLPCDCGLYVVFSGDRVFLFYQT